MEFEPLDQFQQRRKKLTEIEALGHASYPHKFEWTHTARQVAEKFGERTAEQLAAEHVDVVAKIEKYLATCRTDSADFPVRAAAKKK